LGSADFTPGYFVHDPATVPAQSWSGLSINEPEKFREDELGPSSPPQGVGSPRPSHNIRNTLKRFSGTARTVLQPNQSTYTARTFTILNDRQIGKPKFKLPIEAPSSAFLAPRRLTDSMITSSSTGSTGVVSYASRSNLASATARTMDLNLYL
jgi:hypothetical protein